MTSQPETELSGNEELNEDSAVLEQLAKKREQPAEEGAEAEEEQEVEGEDEPEQEEPEDDDPEYDLGDIKAKKSQILAWKQGEMKDADYRQKTAEAAEAKRAAQAIQERVEQERNHYANQLDVLVSQMQAELIGDQQALAQLAADDPAEWVRQNAYYQQKFQRFQQAIQERQVIAQRADEEAGRKRADTLRAEMDALHSKIPEWRNPDAKRAELEEMDGFLKRNGYDESADLSAFMDHRIYLLARKAWQADKREAARAAAKDKQVKQQPPKALKPGVASNETKVATDAYKDAVKRAKSGREDDLMALLAAKRRNA